ncbi:hypothetical protein [Flavobacterium urocaniciphilum]|uniref:Microcystin-dependent protein n=1 Tax=Flavobacterium urocaniciphilum TaxID=1299341 RepID=A0A1H9CQ96_9FLAO|nr:hypothetical protein [Flavobacterium urocaniciphilum]SEQ03392.1 hypothetical protein SAMN05444005_10522 [Flavobacterium urocaniciphilum]
MKKFTFFVYLITISAFGQVGINTDNPNSDSYLELESTDKGLLIPRLNLTALNNPSPLTAHVAGMLVYNTGFSGTMDNIVYPGLYINNGTSWERLEPNTTQIGEVKHSFATTDHDGWYLLNGRALSTLTPTAQSAASILGYGSNLPDATDRFLKTVDTSESVAIQGGTNTFTLSQAQLPNVNFNGSTSNDGGHTHQVDSYQGNQNVGLLSTSALTLFTILKVAENDHVSTINRTTSTTPSHAHTVTVNSGGTGAAVTRVPAYLSTNVFIYLGI